MYRTSARSILGWLRVLKLFPALPQNTIDLQDANAWPSLFPRMEDASIFRINSGLVPIYISADYHVYCRPASAASVPRQRVFRCTRIRNGGIAEGSATSGLVLELSRLEIDDPDRVVHSVPQVWIPRILIPPRMIVSLPFSLAGSGWWCFQDDSSVPCSNGDGEGGLIILPN